MSFEFVELDFSSLRLGHVFDRGNAVGKICTLYVVICAVGQRGYLMIGIQNPLVPVVILIGAKD
jgi:hypothetical protein